MGARDREAGSGVVDFLLVTGLLLFLFLAVVQVGLVVHTRTLLVAAAAEGARYGADADRTPEQGAERAREAVADTLSVRTARGLTIVPRRVTGPDGLTTVQVQVSGEVPVVLVPLLPVRLTVRGHALQEGR